MKEGVDKLFGLIFDETTELTASMVPVEGFSKVFPQFQQIPD